MPKENSKGFAEAYKTTLRENKKRYVAESHRPGQINKARQLSSRSRYPVSGTVAPIERKGTTGNIYQNGNKYNIAQEVYDNGRHSTANTMLAMSGVGKYDSDYADIWYNGARRKGLKKRK